MIRGARYRILPILPLLVMLGMLMSMPMHAQLSGVKTIDPLGSGPNNYASFTAAVTALTTSGVSGAVTFNVAAGTYSEQISLPAITGTSATNTITFKSASGIRASVNLTYAATVSTSNYTVQLNGADYVTFRDMTLTATGATYGVVVDVRGGSDYLTIENNDIVGVPTTGSSGNYCVVYGATNVGLDNYLVVRNNTVRNGSYSIILTGNSSTALETGTLIENNICLDFSYAGIYITYVDAPIITRNYVSSSVSTIYVMITASYCMNALRVTKNRVYIPITTGGMRGIFINYCTASSGLEGITANNMVYMYGGPNEVNLMLIYQSYFQKILFNTNYTPSTYATGSTIWVSGGANCTFKNNIFYNAGTGYAGNFLSTATVSASDYNLFYTGGVSLAMWTSARANLAALQAASGMDANSKSKVVNFVNPSTADLHVTGTSWDDPDLVGLMMTEVTDDFDNDIRIRPGMGADEGLNLQGQNNAGITALLSPNNFCAGLQPVTVKLFNGGLNRITSCTIKWQINGVQQSDYPWAGLLDTLNVTTRTTAVTLGSVNFLPNTPYTILAWVTFPNGLPDPISKNDSLVAVRKASLTGAYTIGGTAPNYPSFTAAVADLNANGICGPVVFNVRSGTYNEQITINEIAGASSTNTITFQSETGVNTDVNLTYSANSSMLYTLLLNGADWIRFNNMTITGTNASYARVITFMSGATNNIFFNNRIIGPNVASSSTNNANIYTYSTGDHNNEFNSNLIQYNGFAAYCYGSGTGAGQMLLSWKFRNNRILDFYYYGLYLYYHDAVEVTGNLIQTSSASTNYMVYGYYVYNKYNFSANRIISLNTGSYTKYGLMLYYAQAAVGNEALISNNFISIAGSTTAYGMYLYYPYNVNVEFNTVNNRQTTASGYTLYLYYGQNVRWMNNILYNTTTGYLTYIYTTTWRGMDYNVYYTPYTTFGYWNGTTYANFAAWQTITTQEQRSLFKTVQFTDITTGDLHLTGSSRNDMTLTGVLQPYITTDVDGDPRIIPYRGADEACYILPGTVTYSFTDVSGKAVSFGRLGDNVYAKLNVSFPTFDINVTLTLNFYSVPGNQLVYTYTINATKANGVPLLASYTVPIPVTLAAGYYRIDGVFNTRNSCGDYIDYRPGDKSLLIISPGADPCIVWPGDVNNDGVCNYGDRTSLNKYIFNANLRATWLQGPARYRADYATNPFTYYTWEPQASAPWFTPEGCYMDADGNGVINNYDLLPIKINFMKSNGTFIPKQEVLSAAEFGLGQNHPNPFNPSTTLQYSIPERSMVTITVTDALGRTVAVLVNQEMPAGTHAVLFDGGMLGSGVYVATAGMTGIESGLRYISSVRMLLSK